MLSDAIESPISKFRPHSRRVVTRPLCMPHYQSIAEKIQIIHFGNLLLPNSSLDSDNNREFFTSNEGHTLHQELEPA